MNYNRFFKEEVLNLKLSRTKQSHQISHEYPGILYAAGGVPNPELYPFSQASIVLAEGTTIHITQEAMTRALNYPDTDGFPDFKQWMLDFHWNYHKPGFTCDQSQFDILVTNGAEGALDVLFHTFLSKEDSIVVGEFSYTHHVDLIKTYGAKMIGVEMDAHGYVPKSLRTELQRVDAGQSRVRPKFLLIVPVGSNPTGCTSTLERKNDIYKIAQEYDLMIFEDDVNHFLQYDGDIAPSYQSLDVDGRVIRVDSFSKILAAGIRVGWISGPEPVMQKLLAVQFVKMIGPCQISQTMMRLLLDEWGLEGFWKHIRRARAFYKEKRDLAVRAAERWLIGLAEWNPPVAGIVLWIKLIHLDDSDFLFERRTFENGVLVVPGSDYQLNREKKSNYFRMVFSLLSSEDMNECFKRLAFAISQEMDRIGVTH